MTKKKENHNPDYSIPRAYVHTDGRIYAGYVFRQKYERVFILIDCQTCKYIQNGQIFGKHPTSKIIDYFFIRMNKKKWLVKLISEQVEVKVNRDPVEKIRTSFIIYLNKYPLSFDCPSC